MKDFQSRRSRNKEVRLDESKLIIAKSLSLWGWQRVIRLSPRAERHFLMDRCAVPEPKL